MPNLPEKNAIGGIVAWSPDVVSHLESRVLMGYLQDSRWFGGKRRTVQQVQLSHEVPGSWPDDARLFLAEVRYADAETEKYLIPLALLSKARLEHELEGGTSSIVTELESGEVVVDALCLSAFRAAVLALFRGAGQVEGGLRPSPAISAAVLEENGSETRLVRVEQSNASITVGAGLWLKVYRKLERGLQVEVEVLDHLHRSRVFPHIPPIYGSLVLSPEQGGSAVAVLMGKVSHVGDGWATALACLDRGFDEMAAHDSSEGRGDGQEFPASMKRFLARSRQLGRRTRELHLALAMAGGGDQAFAPVPWTGEEARGLRKSIHNTVERLLGELHGARASLPPEWSPMVSCILEGKEALLALLDRVPLAHVGGQMIRIHGDLHLAQVLDTGADFIFIDFEGEPTLPMAERRAKRLPLKDVAGMVRSFHYAAAAALKMRSPEERGALREVAERWAAEAIQGFLDGYREVTAHAPMLPQSPQAFDDQLASLLLEKAAAEVLYELRYRPAWADIPLRGLCSLINPDETALSNSL